MFDFRAHLGMSLHVFTHNGHHCLGVTNRGRDAHDRQGVNDNGNTHATSRCRTWCHSATFAVLKMAARDCHGVPGVCPTFPPQNVHETTKHVQSKASADRDMAENLNQRSAGRISQLKHRGSRYSGKHPHHKLFCPWHTTRPIGGIYPLP